METKNNNDAVMHDADGRIILRFYRKYNGEWYADVKGHTEAQNRMVAGADALCEKLSRGRDEVTITMTAETQAVDRNGRVLEHSFRMRRVEHDPFGATYIVFGAGIPRPVWLCNVTHSVFGGEHPKLIFVYDIFPGGVFEVQRNPERDNDGSDGSDVKSGAAGDGADATR